MQAMRWLALSLYVKDPLIAWRLTFLPDPLPMNTPGRAACFDLNSSFLEPGQLTASLGMSKDMEALAKRMGAAGSGGGGTGSGGGAGREKNKSGPKAKVKGKEAAPKGEQ
jgi:hypothetical protein